MNMLFPNSRPCDQWLSRMKAESHPGPECLPALCLVSWQPVWHCRVLGISCIVYQLPPININRQQLTLAAPCGEALCFLRPSGVHAASPPWQHHHHLFIQHLSTPTPTPPPLECQTVELISSLQLFQICWIAFLCLKPPPPTHTHLTTTVNSMHNLNYTKRAHLTIWLKHSIGDDLD